MSANAASGRNAMVRGAERHAGAWRRRLRAAIAAVCLGSSALSGPVQASPASGKDACERERRSVPFGESTPVEVRLAPHTWTELVFPEPIYGIRPDQREGLLVKASPLPDRVHLSLEKRPYRAYATVHTRNGRSFYLLLRDSDCPDIAVTAERDVSLGPDRRAHEVRGRHRRGLMEWMLLGRTPPGYRRKTPKGGVEERLIARQGSVDWYLKEVYEGRNYRGYVIEVVNRAPVGVRIAISRIEMPGLREVAMLPPDHRLGPAPKTSAGAIHKRNRGLLFLVVKKTRRDAADD